MSRGGKLVLLLAAVGAAGWLALAIRNEIEERGLPEENGPARGPAPVEVAPIERGPITLRRTFSGALESSASFAVAPKVGGRVERLAVDFADPVERGQVVAWLDDDEFVQAVAQAEAEVAVARANEGEAKSALEIAERSLARIQDLREKDVASASELDTAMADHLAKQARLEVTVAQRARADAALETARIRLGYTTVAADWTGGDERRVIADRFVEEGDTVAANAPLVSIVDLDPISGVVYVPERDYARLEPGQRVTLTTDGFPGEEFVGRIDRIAPVFRQATRQARAELLIENPQERLKPGMFIRATVVLDHVEDAVVVPVAALTRRRDHTGVFVVDAAGSTVAWHPVTEGIREGDRVQVFGDGLSGRVVTLGQQLLDDGAPITIPDAQEGGAVPADDSPAGAAGADGATG